MTIAIDSFGVTDQGRIREANEDNFLIVELRKSVDVKYSSIAPELTGDQFGAKLGNLFVVADGVGSGPEGERASGDAIKAMLRYVGETVGCFQSLSAAKEHELFERLEATVGRVHQTLADSQGFTKQAPATTLTMVLLVWPRAYFIHVGDSRAYVRRGGRVQRLTQDQTFGEYMVTLGAWTEEQAAKSRPGATLTSAVGGPQMQPVVGLIDLEPGDSLMLCSDGLIKHVSDERITTIMGESGNAESQAKKMLKEALEGGGTDNVTVIVVRST